MAQALISIHAPPRGATEWQDSSDALSKISIHAPPRGATHILEDAAKPIHISIHAPPRGATVLNKTNDEWYEFQFTPLREGRPR